MRAKVLQRDHNVVVSNAEASAAPADDHRKSSIFFDFARIRGRTAAGAYSRYMLLVTICAVIVVMWVSLSLSTDMLTGDMLTRGQTWRPIATMSNGRYTPVRQQYHICRSTKRGPFSPNTNVVLPPFTDMCEWISPTHRLSMADAVEMPAAAYATDSAFRAQLESALDRFEHVPADGGDAGRRWSAATGLPLASGRTGAEVKVRFVSVSNRIDPTTHFASVAAAMAGARLDMIGMGWKHFTFTKRARVLLSYAQQEGLTDADVIVSTDADAVMSGEDALPFFSAFVASTAADEAEHMTYRVRDIRMGRRQTPIIFSAEATCWAHETFHDDSECVAGYRHVLNMREQWVTSTNESMQHGFNDHAFKYLNAGVMVARVWAIRHIDRVFAEMMSNYKPRRKWETWTCDQSAFAAIHLDLLKWELESKAWDGPMQALPESRLREYLYPAKELPKAGYAAHNLPPGLMNVDQFTRLSLTIEESLSGRSVYGFNSEPIRMVSEPEGSVRHAVERGMPGETSPMGLVTTRSRLAMTPRSHVDCAGVASSPPECAYRDAVWGIPPGAKAVVPLLWHFSGDNKVWRFAHYRTLFPWYLPTVINTEALQNLVHVFSNLPPSRVFWIDPATNNDAFNGPARVLAHNASEDLSVMSMCLTTVLKPKS